MFQAHQNHVALLPVPTGSPLPAPALLPMPADGGAMEVDDLWQQNAHAMAPIASPPPFNMQPGMLGLEGLQAFIGDLANQLQQQANPLAPEFQAALPGIQGALDLLAHAEAQFAPPEAQFAQPDEPPVNQPIIAGFHFPPINVPGNMPAQEVPVNQAEPQQQQAAAQAIELGAQLDQLQAHNADPPPQLIAALQLALDPLGQVVQLQAQPAPVAVPVPPLTRAIHRKRSLADTEPAVWDTEDPVTKKTVRTEEQQVFLRSVMSEATTSVIFHNTSSSQAVAIWLDYNGQEVAYGSVLPGEKRRYRTFATHPWIMRDARTDSRLMLAGRLVLHASAQQETVVISDLPPLVWSRDSHHLFPETFKAASKALLLCHARGCATMTKTAFPTTSPTAKNTTMNFISTSAAIRPSMAMRSHPPPMLARLAASLTGCALLAPPCSGLQSMVSEPLPASDNLRDGFFDVSFEPFASPRTDRAVPVVQQQQQQHVRMGRSIAASVMSPVMQPLLQVASRALACPWLAAQAPSAAASAPAHTLLAQLPLHLVHEIIRMAAPHVPQTIDMPVRFRPNIAPALLPTDPAIWPPMAPTPEEAATAAAAAGNGGVNAAANAAADQAAAAVPMQQ